MLIKYTFDIQTQQPVYAVCNVNHECVMLTTNLLNAINKVQGK